MIRKAYLDTSVYGGYFDTEFSNDTRAFFQRISDEKITVIISELLEEELSMAPIFVKKLFTDMSHLGAHYVNVTDEVEKLANIYIDEKVVGKTSYADCVHIALATVNNVDILASWNFKHIVNIDKIRGYNSINMRLGYPLLEIRTPKEILKYDNL